MTAEVNIVSAFTANGKGGNPAAVVLNADRFSAQQKQDIAARASLSETAFVGQSNVAAFKLEFFTPTRQIAHCGHATVAAFAFLKQTGLIAADVTLSVKETIDGTREIRFAGSEVYMEQKEPVFTYPDAHDEQVIYNSLGLNKAAQTYQPTLVYTGNRFMVLEVDSEEQLQHLTPDHEIIARISEKYGLIGYYVFCCNQANGIDATTRMFAPAYGIPEEAATGMAAGPLAAYLYQFGYQKSSYVFEQGRFMHPASPSIIKVELLLEDEKINSIYAGGNAALVDKRAIEII